jgi:isoleucyl-tRNA synthetase
VVVKFKLKTKPASAAYGCKSYCLLAWTTTPWTLPSNLALAVNPDMQYTCVVVNDECLILAKSAVERYFDAEAPNEFDGHELVGLEYFPLFDYFKDHPNSFKVLAGDFVTDTDGTGVVHMAPGFGEDDQILCNKHGIKLVCPVDDAGQFTNEVPDFAGLQVFAANDPIIRKLKMQDSWFKTEQYIHNYPHCWRTDTPLIYRAMSSWYIKVTNIKDDLIKANQQINWIPEHIKDGLFGKWLEGARDWSISRNRFWGTPIPIWESSDPRYPRIDVYGSIPELERDFGVKITDLHRPFIDNLTRPNPDDPTGQSIMRRTSDVFDCWFDSGAMPYSQVHYPFENQARFDDHPSADFIVEYVAQTRGWFYTLMVLSVALFNRPAFLNCICHGVILDAQGQKLSKRLKNYADPREIFAKYGSDALRFVMVSSQVMRGQELCIDKDGKMVQEAVRLVLKPIWNAYNFFTLYANADHIRAELTTASNNLNDRYILSKLKVLIASIESSLDQYDLPDACTALVDFFEVLNNWYIRRSRSRFWRSEYDADKQAAYDTLYTVLHQVAIAASPLLPLLLEHIFLALTNRQASVHLQDYPNHDEFLYDQDLVDSIDKVRAVCTSALNIRNTYQIRTRQPLSQLIIVGEAFAGLDDYLDLIKDEVNVKEVVISKDVSTYAKFNLKINFKEVSKRLAHRMKDLLAASKAGQWSKTASGNISLADEELLPHEFSLTLEPIGDTPSAVIGNGEGLAILNTTIDRGLELEGLARDVVRMIQQARKKANFYVSDRIVIEVDADQTLSEAIEAHRNYIMEQTLASELNSVMQSNSYAVVEQESIDGHSIKIGLEALGS